MQEWVLDSPFGMHISREQITNNNRPVFYESNSLFMYSGITIYYYPNYFISLADANINQSIGVVFNLDKLHMHELKCCLCYSLHDNVRPRCNQNKW